MNQLDSQGAQSIESAGVLHVMKSKPLREALVDSIYKSSPHSPGVAGQQTEDMFPEVSLSRSQLLPDLLTVCYNWLSHTRFDVPPRYELNTPALH